MRSAVETSEAPQRVRWAVELLGVEPRDQVLEIGCGPGHAVALVCQRLGPKGVVTAIDRSAAQVTRARTRNRACVAAGRARIECVALTDFDPRRRFDKVLAVNVNAFWTTPAAALADARRLLAPRGALHLVYEPPAAARLRELRASVPRLLREHAFEVERVVEQAFRRSHALCIIGRPAR